MSEKTEAPTPRRLADARERGQIARSIELNAAAALIGGIWLLQGPGKTLAGKLGDLIRLTMANLSMDELTDVALKTIFLNNAMMFLLPFGEMILGLMIIGLVVSVAQTGFAIASKRSFFDFGRLNPINGFKRIFSMQGLVEVLKSLLKLLVVGWPVYTYISSDMESVIKLANMDMASGISAFLEIAANIMWRVAGAYVILAIADYIYQVWNHRRGLRMSKQDILDEFKKTEGDPFLRGRIRSQQRRMARMRMMSKVPTADVVVTNPTHFAVAVTYKQEKMDAPQVVAKGSFELAQRIVEIARENEVPVVENVLLARALYQNVDVDGDVPPDLYVLMAEVLAFVYRQRAANMQYSAA
ncbi:MAG: flagellar biosynthesis protein FlhB [Anaerolineaceae bacterium]